MNGVTINFEPVIKLTDEEFYQLCQLNQDLRLERKATGELIIMPPTGGETGRRNASISAELGNWNHQSKLGIGFDSSVGLKLPKGSDHSPDIAWIKMERWQQLSQKEKEKFIPIPPDFVVELMSPTDSLKTTQAKMEEYLDNGVKLGWLIDPKTKIVEIYREGKSKEILENPVSLSGEDLLPGFVLNLESIW